MCLRWHILISYRFVVEVDFKVLTCSKSRKYCLFSDEKKLRENANYTGAFIVENFKPSFQDIYLEFTGMKSLWLKQCISQRKAKKDTKSWKKLAVMENISGILKLFVTTPQFAQFGGASKAQMQNYYHANFALVFSCMKAW